MRWARKLAFSTACLLALPSGRVRGAALAEPVVDTGLSTSTPSPDADLVMVRERFYGSQQIDLTPYGIGTGSDNFVQSVYFRLYPQNPVGIESSIQGTVTFPLGVRILGFITTGSQLGSTSPGSPYTQSDALFAVAANPGDYVAPSRGFEVPGTGTGSSEFICQINERSFYFGLDVLGAGADDFRVIVDYGIDFNPGLTFEVNLFTDKLGNVSASPGIRVGRTAGLSPGEGDHGEITHLRGAQLTTDLPLTGTSGPPVSGRDVLYLLRETGINPEVDGFDISTGASIPGLVYVPPPFTEPPRALAFGDDGMLYLAGNHGALTSVDTATGETFPIPTSPLQGVVARMATLRGDSRLFILRQTSFPDPEDAWIDTYDTATHQFTPAFATFPTNLLPFPVDLVGSANGLLYALGTGDAFHAIDPVTANITPFAIPMPNLPGDNVRATPDPWNSRVYILRDTPSGDTFVDTLDTATRVFQEALFVLPGSTIPDIGAMVVDNQGMLWVSSKNGGMMAMNPGLPEAPPFFETPCLDFLGTTNYAAVQRLPVEVSPMLSATPLTVTLSPDPGMLRLAWEDMGDPALVYNIYSGSMAAYYSHGPDTCHLPPLPGSPGYLIHDLPMPADSLYYFVTSSNAVAESPAGPRPISAGAPACGPLP